jgi:hypothetical protein
MLSQLGSSTLEESINNLAVDAICACRRVVPADVTHTNYYDSWVVNKRLVERGDDVIYNNALSAGNVLALLSVHTPVGACWFVALKVYTSGVKLVARLHGAPKQQVVDLSSASEAIQVVELKDTTKIALTQTMEIQGDGSFKVSDVAQVHFK